MFRVEIKVRNAKLYNAITKDCKTVGEFCRLHDLSPSEVGNLINFKDSPMNSRWEWRPVVLRICDITGDLPDDLFPEQMRIVLERNTRALELDAAQVAELSQKMDPAALLEASESSTVVRDALSKLPKRDRHVLMLRFGINKSNREMTLEEIGEIFNVDRERIRQIEAKALRKLREPKMADALRELLEGYSGVARRMEDSEEMDRPAEKMKQESLTYNDMLNVLNDGEALLRKYAKSGADA